MLGGLLFDVSGSQVYKIASDGTRTLLGGSIADDGSPVSFAGDHDELIVHSVDKVYRVTASTVTHITDYNNGAGVLPSIYFVAYLSGWFLYVLADGQFAYSEANDGDSIGALNFATAESSPDGLQCIIILRQTALLIGTETIEEWVVTGGSDIPFVPRKGADQDRGCINRHAAIQADNTVFWVGDDLVFYRLGETPQRVSTSTLEEALSDLSSDSLAALKLVKVEWQGHLFLILDVPGKSTWAYDVQTNTWPEIAKWGSTTFGIYGHVIAHTKNIVATSFGGLHYLNSDVVADPLGNPIERVATAHMRDVPRDMRGNNVFLLCRKGVGNSAVPDPQVMMRFSKDGGFTWSSVLTRSMGKIGQYARRARWNRLGMAKDNGAIFEFRVTDACAMRFDAVKVNER